MKSYTNNYYKKYDSGILAGFFMSLGVSLIPLLILLFFYEEKSIDLISAYLIFICIYPFILLIFNRIHKSHIPMEIIIKLDECKVGFTMPYSKYIEIPIYNIASLEITKMEKNENPAEITIYLKHVGEKLRYYVDSNIAKNIYEIWSNSISCIDRKEKEQKP